MNSIFWIRAIGALIITQIISGIFSYFGIHGPIHMLIGFVGTLLVLYNVPVEKIFKKYR